MKLMKLFKAGAAGNLLALLSGVLLTLSFAPFNIIPLAVIAPLLLLTLWLNGSPRQAFLRGWLFGLGHFGSGVYWVYISINTFSEAGAIVASVITLGLINILAFFPAITGYTLTKYFSHNNNLKILCAFPAIWVFLEWIRGFIFTGFPWLDLGYSQIHSPLKGYAPIASVYSISLLLLISSGLIYNCCKYFNNKTSLQKNLGALAIIWLLGAGLSFINYTRPHGDSVQVSLVQGNIPQEIKWVPEHLQSTLDTYEKLTNKHWDSSIIIWPEGAIPEPLQDAKEFLIKMAHDALQHHVTLITGIPIQASAEGGYNNGVIAVGSDSGLYLKRRLVPFGEYIPLQRYVARLLDILHLPMSDFVPGTGKEPPIVANGIPISTFICYEIAYMEQVLNQNENIGMMLTVSDDAWFGHSIAQAQHLQIAQMRALESQRPLLFVSNDGITAIVSEKGKVQARLPSFVTAVLTGKVQPRHGLTPLQYLGSNAFMMPLIIMLILAFSQRKQP